MTDTPNKGDLLEWTTVIVSSHVSRSPASLDDVDKLIGVVYQALSGIAAGTAAADAERPEPAVSVRRSVTPDYIICLEDGRKLKMLKRHLNTAYNMTPDQYRARWDLPADYPMVAPNYAAKRSTLARKIGLGTRRRG